MTEVEGFEELLAKLRTRPGLWLLLTTTDERSALMLRDALRQAAGERVGSVASVDPQETFAFESRGTVGEFSVYARHVPDETDELNPQPPPTSGLATRRFRGVDQAEMLRRVADYIDRANPGRTIVGMWCVPPSDGSQDGMELDVVVEHDEDAYEYDPHDD